jgi:hypothetical protein
MVAPRPRLGRRAAALVEGARARGLQAAGDGPGPRHGHGGRCVLGGAGRLARQARQRRVAIAERGEGGHLPRPRPAVLRITTRVVIWCGRQCSVAEKFPLQAGCFLQPSSLMSANVHIALQPSACCATQNSTVQERIESFPYCQHSCALKPSCPLATQRAQQDSFLRFKCNKCGIETCLTKVKKFIGNLTVL